MPALVQNMAAAGERPRLERGLQGALRRRDPACHATLVCGRSGERSGATAEAAVREIDATLRSLNNDLPLLQTPDATARRQALEAERDRLNEEASRQRQTARDEQVAGDAIYWPIFNLDRKNPNAAETLEHLPTEQLVAEIVAKERRILELMAEIEAELREGVA